MPQVIISRGARRDVERLRDFLKAHDANLAAHAIQAIAGRLKHLGINPAIGRFADADKELRELMIAFGASGHVALYRFDELRDRVVVLAIRHQREAGYPGIP